MKISKYWKSILAVLGATGVAAEVVVSDNMITGNEWVNLGIALFTAVGVFLVPNKDGSESSHPGVHAGQDWERL